MFIVILLRVLCHAMFLSSLIVQVLINLFIMFRFFRYRIFYSGEIKIWIIVTIVTEPWESVESAMRRVYIRRVDSS